ncbi:MAG TPA: potassium transporter [Prolixibacteraceae bacterium]|nr:potassium transporter [Prolixibacteraceae bacterium]
MNVKIILRVAGLLMLVEGVAMMLALMVSLIYNESDTFGIALASAICVGSGTLLYLLTRKASADIGKREGFIIVALVWILFSLSGALPYVFTGAIPSYTDAFFETMSGFTTTGASVLNNIEELPHGILFWRALTHWLGGMGIIVLSLAILPVFGIGGMQLYIAEVPGPTPDKISPRIRQTAASMWIIYVVLTLLETVLLWIGKMPLFDAVCHSFATMATGGFSTKQASIAFWPSPYIQYVIILFMFLAGTNFTLTYFALRGKFKPLIKDEEFRYYGIFTLGFTLIIFIGLMLIVPAGVEETFRNSLFWVVSIMTTTGFATVDYMLWPPALVVVIFAVFFFGGSAGSTGGGLKIMRVVMLLKNGYYELKRMVHPNAIIPLKFNKHVVDSKIMNNVLAFAVLYIMIFGVSSVIFMIFEPDMATSMGAVASSLGNIGPGLGSVGPAFSYSHIHPLGKWFLSFLMLLGRLELFTILVIFSPAFWKK